MGRMVLAPDNVFSLRTYPSHTLDASSTLSGKDVSYLAAGRRIRALTGWFADDLNTDAWVESIFDAPRAFDFVFVDRDHNLDGETLSVSISDDDFTTSTTVVSGTVPSAPTPNAKLFGQTIVRTNEGALLVWLGTQVAWGVRVEVAAMGTGLRPELAGLLVGKAFVADDPLVKPVDFGRHTLTHTVDRGPLAQDASGEIGRFRSGDLRYRVSSWFEYYEALYPIEELFLARKPTVLVLDDERAELAAFVRASPGQAGFEIGDGRYFPEARLAYEETEPELL